MSNWVNGNLQGRLSIGQGERGKSLECMWRGTELGIRVEGEEKYQFVNLAGGSAGSSAREIELQVGNGYIQWRYKGEEWNNLIAITELQVPGLPGRDGNNGTNGKDGVTPNITIGTVTTLEAGQQATVVNSGTKENPIFEFGIPKGERGSSGSDGATPDMTEFKKKINEQCDAIENRIDEHIKNCTGGSGINIATFEISKDGNLYCLTVDENSSNINYSINEAGELEVEING